MMEIIAELMTPVRVMTVILILIYTGIAIGCVFTRRSIGGSIITAIPFICGGNLIVPVANLISQLLCVKIENAYYLYVAHFM